MCPIDSSKSGSANAKKTMPETKIVVEGQDDPFSGFKKLLQGFCDPSKPKDDVSTLPKAPSIPDPTSQTSKSRDLDSDMNGINEPVSSKKEVKLSNPKPESPNGSQETETLLQKTETKPEKPAKVQKKETKEGAQKELAESKSTVANLTGLRRGIEVFIFAIVAVLGTIVVLERVGYKVDFTVMKSQHQLGLDKLIQINYNDKIRDALIVEENIVGTNVDGVLENDSDVVDEEHFVSGTDKASGSNHQSTPSIPSKANVEVSDKETEGTDDY